jgi:hypothetical protein
MPPYFFISPSPLNVRIDPTSIYQVSSTSMIYCLPSKLTESIGCKTLASRCLSFVSSYQQLFGRRGFRGSAKLWISKIVAINHLNTLANYRGG